MVADGDSLVEGPHEGKLHNPLQIRLTGEVQDEGVVGIHLKVGKQPQLLQGTGLVEMGLIDDQEYGLSRTLPEFQKALLDLTIDGALGEPRGETEETIKVIQ